MNTLDVAYNPLIMPTAAQMADVGAAAELLLEALAKAGRYPYPVPVNLWHTVRISICTRSDGTLVLADAFLSTGIDR